LSRQGAALVAAPKGDSHTTGPPDGYNIAMKSATSFSLSARRRVQFITGIVAVVFAGALLTSLVGPSARGDSSGLKGKLLVLVVDRVSIEDFPSAETPFCAGLAREWSVGMMVTQTAEPVPRNIRSWTSYSVGDLGADYVTLGEGVRAKGARDAGQCFNSGERVSGFGSRTAGALYSKYTGYLAPDVGVVCLGYPQVQRNNDAAGNKDNAGLLGKLLIESGHQPAVVGNSDTLSRPARLSPLICCDQYGAVPLGDVSKNTQIQAPNLPGGYQTSVDALLEESRRLLGLADMLVVDTGDTGRIDRESGSLNPDLLERQRASALRKVDRIARDLASLLDLNESLMMVVSPGAPLEKRSEGDYLTPFIAAGKGFSRGLLTSQSTRRPGLINNIDLLPTALRFFDVEWPSQVVGTPSSTVKSTGDTVKYLKRLDRQFAVTRRARWPIVITYAAIAAVFTCIAALCIPGVNSRLRWPRDPRRLRTFIAPVSVVLLSAPLSFMVVSAFHYGGAVFPAIFCIGFSILVGGGAWLLQRGARRMDPFVAVCLLTSLVMLVDLFFGGRLVMIPILGVSALEGLRMYGLTNTLAALLIATFAWGVSGLAGDAVLKRGIARYFVLMALLVFSFVVGFGGLGANAGAFITALAVTLTFFTATSQRGFTAWRTTGIVAATALGTGLMVLLDSVIVHTHAGRVVSGGTSRFLPLVQRKLMIQLGQISFYLFPAIILIAAVVAFAIWFKRPGSFWESRWEAEKLQTATLFSLVVGSLVALVFNDTGIAMMAVMTLVSVLAMAFYLFQGRVEKSAGVLPESV
jgi:hypothetical protein